MSEATTTVATTTVRQAIADDIPWLLEQLRAFDRFFGARHSLFPDEAYARAVLQEIVAAQPFLVAVRGADRLGFIAGHLAPHPFNPRVRVLTELFWWVVEDARGGRAGQRLLDAFLALGREQADQIVMTLEAKSQVNPATLERRGFHLHESSYLLEVA